MGTKTLVEQLNWKVLGYGQGGYHYNPHVSKPVALEPIGEDGGYSYFGPPPDFGASYGLFSDGENTISTRMAPEVYSPMNGRPMKYAGPIDLDEIKKSMSGSKFSHLLHSCQECSNSCVTSSDSVEDFHCPVCGSKSEYSNAIMRGRKNRR
jgi:hypothetical protein